MGMWAVVLRVGGGSAVALRPLWSAWDWLTGRRTVEFAWLLWSIAATWDTARDIGEGDIFNLVFGVFAYAYIGWNLWQVTLTPPNDQNADTISLEAAMRRTALACMAGIVIITEALFLLVDLLGALLSDNPVDVTQHVITGFATLALLAGAVDHASGGKSCLRRAADRIAEAFQPAPSPAGVPA